MSKLTRTAVAIDIDLLARFDEWTADRGYTNRSEAVRDLIRSALVEAEWESPTAKVVATVSIIYDHERRDLAQQIVRLQHAEHHTALDRTDEQEALDLGCHDLTSAGVVSTRAPPRPSR